MNAIDIIILLFCIFIVLLCISIYIYKKIKKKPTGDCASCGDKGKNLLKYYNKKYKNIKD